MKLDDIINAATPGPWTVKGKKAVDAEESFPGTASHYHIVNCCCPWAGPRWEAEARGNARFIAAFDPEHVRLMEAVCEAAERWSREDETPNIARNEHALVCATAALDAYRKERGIE